MDEEISLIAYQDLMVNLLDAIKNCEYQKIVNLTDVMLYEHWLKILDIRAIASAKQGKPQQALCDAQRMIDFAPELARGYVRKADIYHTYGYQLKAVSVYHNGIFNTTQYHQSQKLAVDQLYTGKEMAIRAHHKQIDFFSKNFPTEILDSIISFLPRATQISCLAVSKLWQTRILQCETGWKSLLIDDNDREFQLLISVIHHIAPYTRHMTLNSMKEGALAKCFMCMRSNHFKNLLSLKITGYTSNALQQNTVVLSIALWQARHTLTTLDIDVARNSSQMSVIQILQSCPTIKALVYTCSTPLFPMKRNSDRPVLFQVRDTYRLEDLVLNGASISGEDIKPILRQCQQLQRLVLHGANGYSSILTTLTFNKKIAPNLKILVINPSDYPPIPTLQDINSNDEEYSGLRILQTNNSGAAYIELDDILPILYENRGTLKNLYCSTAETSPVKVRQFNTRYPDFKFENLTSMLICLQNDPTQEFWLRLIRNSTTLSDLKVVGVPDIRSLVNTVSFIPSITSFGVSHEPDTSIRTGLIQLINTQIQLSNTSSPSLNSIRLRYCDAINDNVLLKLERITTLQDIWFGGSIKISYDKAIKFFNNLNGRLTKLTLEDMGLVDNNMISSLGNLDNLSSLKLISLKNINDNGVLLFVYKKSGPNSKMTELILKACPYVTSACTSDAKKKIKTVSYMP